MMKIVLRLKKICPRRVPTRANVLDWTWMPALPVTIRQFSSACHYEVLDVPKTASQEEIKRAFFEKSKKFHPDVSPKNPHHHKIFVKLNNSYSILGDKSKRKDYDKSLMPKQTMPSYRSNENMYKYAENYGFYHGDNKDSSGRNMTFTAGSRPKNFKVALTIILIMTAGVTLRLLWLWYRHKQYKKQLDKNSMKASKLYQESRERSSKYTVKEQLEMLAENRGKMGRKR